MYGIVEYSMKILFDIDDTISVTSYKWTEIEKLYMWRNGHKQIKPTSKSSYDISDGFELNDEDMAKYKAYMLDRFPYKDLEEVPGADRAINYLISQGHDITFITNRSVSLYDVTTKWVKEKTGIANPKIIFGVNDKYVRELFQKLSYDIIVDNRINRCFIAQENNVTPILFTGIDVDRTGVPSKTNPKLLNEASNYQEVLKIIDGTVKMKEDNIEIGDYVKIVNNHLFELHPKLPKELKGKYLRVIDLYRDPETKDLVRVSVKCEGIDNPKSKYNCFYIPGKFVKKETNNTWKIPTNKETNNMIANNLYKNNKEIYYIILDKGYGIRQILPVTYDKAIYNHLKDRWVSVNTEDGQEFFVNSSKLFPTKAEAQLYIEVEA